MAQIEGPRHSLELDSIPAPSRRSEPNATHGTQNDDDGGDFDGHSLPPHDHGRAAWRLLLAGFVFEALLWGFPLSFGVFQNYYSQLPEFQGDPYVSVIGTVASGLAYMAAPFIIPIIRRYAKYKRRMIWIGWPICLLGLVAGSFARTLPTLILTQGVMYGVGFTILYYPILDMLNEFWIERRGMAYGVMCSASGVSGAAFPFAIETLLQRYGYPTTLRAIAVGLAVTTGPLIPLLKGRLPEFESTAGGSRTDWSFLRLPLFWIYSASSLAMGLGYFFPSLYIPSYANANGLTSTQGAILLAMMCVSQVLGQMSFGYLSDSRIPMNVLAGSSTFIAATAAYTCWGLAHSFQVMLVFSIIYGFFGAGYTALWGRMGTTISSDPTAAFAAFGLLNFQKGLGNVLAGPISGSLLMGPVDVEDYGSMRYKPLVLFTGSCMLLSATIIPLCYLKHSKWMRSVLEEL